MKIFPPQQIVYKHITQGGHLIPCVAVQLRDSTWYWQSVDNFPMPGNGSEAVRFALQAANRFFELYYDTPATYCMHESTVERRRQTRSVFNELCKVDLSRVRFKIRRPKNQKPYTQCFAYGKIILENL